jgi:hypothetical protein
VASKENCQACKKYAVYRCISCGRRACREHASYVGFVGQRDNQNMVYYCSTCHGFVCLNCVKRGFLSAAPTCPKCRTQLIHYSPYK